VPELGLHRHRKPPKHPAAKPAAARHCCRARANAAAPGPDAAPRRRRRVRFARPTVTPASSRRRSRRRLAKEAGIDISRINGSGPHGRVVARDVEGAKSGKGLKAPAAAPAAAGLAPGMSDKQILSAVRGRLLRDRPHDGMRRTIAQRADARRRPSDLLSHHRLATSAAARRAASRSTLRAEGQGEEAGLQASRQRLRHQGARGGAAAIAGLPMSSGPRPAMLKHKHSDIGVAVAMPAG
jgi:pyruvate dehydrogenase E2 component (dihydrolipoamide acetyltransferase)